MVDDRTISEHLLKADANHGLVQGYNGILSPFAEETKNHEMNTHVFSLRRKIFRQRKIKANDGPCEWLSVINPKTLPHDVSEAVVEWA